MLRSMAQAMFNPSKKGSLAPSCHKGIALIRDTQHHFNEREIDWGFTSFMPLSELHDSCKGYLVNDTVIVEADVSVRCSQDSKKETRSEGHKESSQPPSQENNSKNVVDNAPPGKIRFLSYWVSPEASLVLERIHNRYKGTFAKFSMASVLVQTVFLESFASFIESMSTTKICEVNKEALCVAVKDFEHVGLDLSWLKQRLDQAKMVNKRSELLASIDSYEKTIEHSRAKLRELKEGLAKAKAEAEHLLVYNVPDSETLSYGWSRSAHFSLALIKHLNGDLIVRKDTQHEFNRHKSDWGYTYFIPLGELFDPSRGYLLDDTIIVETDIAVPSRDSKESGSQEESQHPSQDNNSGNVEVDTTAISGEEVSSVESVWQGLALIEASSVDKEAK
ncbi:Ubiquitin carboxyl-terminal hydrolase 12 [Camellia lanceoleosa]|uniref:Ubiquitin carboxyl-terminal hydrolase 12 n=1 Tax=Camellia lanceoleosa TaxID=1840588 RepID=A0ACC0IST9_9ERIC|nr:Ubiquitin carboxyl-terminal hydrolase 12 [Camellia lanceoleosa]